MALPALDPSPLARPLGQSSPTNVFTALDDRLVSGARGVIVVRAASQEGTLAVLGHVTRRLTAIGVTSLGTQARGPVPLFRQVGEQLGLSDLPSDPSLFAGVVSQASVGRDVAVVGHLPREGTWDRAVAREVARDPLMIVVLVADGMDVGADISPVSFELGTSLSASDRQRWWEALGAVGADQVASDDLIRLDEWWVTARRTRPASPRELAALSPLSAELLGSLSLAARSFPRGDLSLLGASDDDLDALIEAGAVIVSRGWVSIDPRFQERAEAEASARPTRARVDIGRALERRFPTDPSAHARAAELFAHADKLDLAERAYERALELSDDPIAHAEIVGRWHGLSRQLPHVQRLPIAVRAAEAALGRGDGADAVLWAQSALGLAPSEFSAVMLAARALTQVGDTVSARALYDQARAAATTEDQRATVSAEMSSILLLAGDVPGAVSAAEEALRVVEAGTTAWFDARNTLGKVMLAGARFDEADAHFAGDAVAAAAAQRMEHVLRAKVNRAIALMSKWHLDESQAILESVLIEARRIGHVRAESMAIDNLAVIAWRQQDFARVLQLHEASVKRLRLGRNLPHAAFAAANLAGVRCQLGLFDQAEETLAFARRLAGPSPEPGRAWKYNYVEAKIAFDRGNLQHAARLAGRSIADARAAGLEEYLVEAALLRARVALAEGDLEGAKAQLDGVDTSRLVREAEATLEILRAALAHAKGEHDGDLADRALASAVALGDRTLLIEAHCQVALHALALDEKGVAALHLDQAAAVRDQVARSLPVGVRNAFLARRDIAVVDELLAVPAAVPLAPSSKSPVSGTRASQMSRELVGDDPAVRALRKSISRVAPSDTTVLICGESGTGKELVAEAIHRASHRAGAPLVSVNCSALVDTLLLSELFGHEKGAFTGASARRRGRFEVAEGGTLFLDEIGDISARAQVALLRVLQEKCYERVGGTVSLRANVRVVCATHRDLRGMVDRGEFREDLYYRLRGVTLELPPLRARAGDIPRISRHLLDVIASERGEAPKSLADDAASLLNRHRWPGNIRELDNALRAASLFADGPVLTAAHLVENVADLRAVADGAPSRPRLDAPVGGNASPRPSGSYTLVSNAATEVASAGAESVEYAYTHVREGRASLGDMKRQIERDCIARALAECGGNITKAAAILGMKRPRLSQLVKHYGMSMISGEELS